MSDVPISRWSVLAVLAMAAGFVAAGSSVPAPAAEGARVLMVDNQPDLTRWHFEPAEVMVPAGATVVWFNKGREDHSVKADDGSFDSGLKKSGASWQRAFPQPGRYTYFCQPHPWMKGTVRVVGATAAATEAPATTTTAAPTRAAAEAPGGSATTSSTFPPTLAGSPPETPATPVTTATPEPAAPPDPTSASEGSSDEEAALAGNSRDSGGNLVGTSALVLLPTAAALAVGARLRRRSKPVEVG